MFPSRSNKGDDFVTRLSSLLPNTIYIIAKEFGNLIQPTSLLCITIVYPTYVFMHGTATLKVSSKSTFGKAIEVF